MNNKFILSKCNITEEEFINGDLAAFYINNNCPGKNIMLLIWYRDGSIIIESETYESAQQYRRFLQGKGERGNAIDPIVCNLNEIDNMIDYIVDNNIITKWIYDETDTSPEAHEFYKKKLKAWDRLKDFTDDEFSN